jgi:hypothetical protein
MTDQRARDGIGLFQVGQVRGVRHDNQSCGRYGGCDGFGMRGWCRRITGAGKDERRRGDLG